MSFNLITILGPTATGKTKLAAKLAHHFKGEIISADSRQVYKSLTIGTGKDLNEYEVDGEKIPYHLIDIKNPEEEFNIFLFKKYFNEVFEEILERKKLPFLTGGSGLYLSSVLQDYKLKEIDFHSEEYEKLNQRDEEDLKNELIRISKSLHNTTDLTSKDRIIKALLVEKSKGRELLNKRKVNSLNIGVKVERTVIRKRIKERLQKRLDEGMIDEVKSLINAGISYERLNSLGLEYRFISLHLKGELTFKEMLEKLDTAIAAFAKRQMTWFRKMEREGVKINWIDGPDFETAKKIIEQNL